MHLYVVLEREHTLHSNNHRIRGVFRDRSKAYEASLEVWRALKDHSREELDDARGTWDELDDADQFIELLQGGVLECRMVEVTCMAELHGMHLCLGVDFDEESIMASLDQLITKNSG